MPYLLEMKNITKTFGSVKAIDNVSLRLNAGEIVSLCGENGSGKSTLHTQFYHQVDRTGHQAEDR